MDCKLTILLLTITTIYGVSWITKKMVGDIGSTVNLECSVQYGNYPVLWIKRGTDGTQDLPISNNSALLVRDPRYDIRHEKASSVYTLQIRDLQENDGGEYMCQVLIDSANRISASVPLFIRRFPVILDNSTSRSVVVSEGMPVKLECYASGFPIPTVLWRRENDALLPTGGSVFSGNELLIPRIQREDRGTYYCIAENGIGGDTRRIINVKVKFAPVVNIAQHKVYQALSSDAFLVCRVQSDPPAAISWIFDSETLVNNEHYEMSQFTSADEFTSSRLLIRNIENKHYGNYICRAENQLGVSEGTIVLYGQNQPSTSGDGSYTPSISWITKEIVTDIGGTVDLECSVQYAGNYPVLLVKKGTDGTQDLPISNNTALLVRDPRYDLHHDKASSTYTLQIRDLQENDGGEYMCQVLIDVKNRTSASVPLLIRRPPVILDNSTRSVVVSKGTPVKLECYAAGFPIPTVLWRRENDALLPTGGSVFM